MTYFVTKSRRTRQPQGVARIDRSIWSAPDLAVSAAAGPINLGANASVTASSDLPIIATSGGLAFAFAGTAGRYLRTTAPYAPTGQLSATILVSFIANEAPQASNNNVIFSGGLQFTWGHSNAAYQAVLTRLDTTAAYPKIAALNKEAGRVTTICGTFAANGNMVLFQDGALCGIDTLSSANQSDPVTYDIGERGPSGSIFNGSVLLAATDTKNLPLEVARNLSANPWQLFAPESRRIYFGASGGGATIITTSGAASLVARAAVAVAATKTAAAASRATIAGTASTTSIRTSALVAKARSAGAAATTTLRTATIAARTVGAGTAATITLRTGLAAGRLTSNAQTTYAAIIAGAFTAAGRTSARGTAAYASTHTATAAATATTSGAAAATTLREGIAVARVDARAAVTAAALVAGTITTTAAAQISARASVSNTTERSAALAAMLALRGANPAAPELPVIVPPSTRTLSPDHTRLGLSPVAPAKPRLG